MLTEQVRTEPTASVDRLRDPAFQAFLILRTAFVVAPILALALGRPAAAYAPRRQVR